MITITCHYTGRSFTGNRINGAAWLRSQYARYPGRVALADLIEQSAETPQAGATGGMTVSPASPTAKRTAFWVHF
jgi:hypothetical protein